MSRPRKKTQSNNLSPGTCHFTDRYISFDTEKETPFKCDETSVVSEFCIFHDPLFWHPKDIVDRIQEKISKGDSSLYCIGYHIPSISINRKFLRNAYFTNSKFHGRITFEGSNFDKVDFSKSSFDDKVFFNNTKFLEKVSFVSVSFKDEARFENVQLVLCDFHNTSFKNEVSFHRATFGTPQKHKHKYTSNFKSLKTDDIGQIHFKDSIFYNKAHFGDSIFANPIKFEKTTFDEEVIFSHTIFINRGTIFFDRVTCTNQIIFSYTQFLGNKYTDFKDCNFQSAKFDSCNFEKGVSFTRVSFSIQKAIGAPVQDPSQTLADFFPP